MRKIILLPFIIFITGCSMVGHVNERQAVISKKTGVHLSFQSPFRWLGPGYRAWPSYEVWSYRKGKEPKDSYISIKVERIQNKERAVKNWRHWQKATDSEIEASEREDFVNPTVKTVAYLSVDDQKIRIRSAYNVSGAQCWGSVIVGNNSVSFSLVTNTSQELDRYIPTFLNFVRSVRISDGAQ